MKRMILCITALVLVTGGAYSQAKKKTAAKHSATAVQPKKWTKAAPSSNTVTLNAVSSNTAKRMITTSQQLSISDPILRTWDARANGANVSLGKSGVVGMPKGAYGFANGHIVLRSTSATTFGTQTGSGAVGTGTSLGTFGSSGSSVPVNGKTPYAGTTMWGNAINMDISKADTIRSKSTMKKQ